MNDEAIKAEPTRRNWVSFWSLLLLQTQNAFNDKAAQFLLIPLGGALMITIPGLGRLEYLLGALIVLPFIIFAPIAGWLSDRFSKTWVIRGSIILQFTVFVWIAVGIWQHNLWMTIAGFFLLSVESVLLSPAKRGIVKEIVGHNRLGFASGILEMGVVLAVLAGQILSSWWFDYRLQGLETTNPGDINNGWNAALLPLAIIACAALPTIAVSFCIQNIPAMGSRRFDKKIFWEHFGQLKDLWEDRRIRLSASGVAFFWGFAGFINLAAIQIGQDVSGGGVGFGSGIAWLMFAASGGIALGGVFASLVCKRRIELGLVPVGGLIMVVGSLALAYTPIASNWIKMWLALAGAGGAILLVPLNAYLQDICPPAKRGRIIAGLNLLDSIVGLTAVMIQAAMAKEGVPYWVQFTFLAVVSFAATSYSAKLLPQHFVRLAVLSLFKVFYRIKTLHADRVPKEGGVLLTPNHVSYMDAFIISVACPRPVRFLMFDGYFAHPWIGKFVRLFNTVPISQARAKDALRVAAEALNEGAVVCIFPEGQLTRTGAMNEFKRGFELIARKASCPVLPVAMDGVWGSIFSFERNKFIYKWPYRLQYGVRVNFAEAIAADEVSATLVQARVKSLRAEAFATRAVLDKPASLLEKKVCLPAGDAYGYSKRLGELGELALADRVRLVANALQIGEVNAIQRHQTVMLEWDGLEHCRDVLGIVFAQYFNLKVVLVDSATAADEIRALAQKYGVEQFIGGSVLCELWKKIKLGGGCYDFSNESLERQGVFPCLAVDGLVVAMSMPHPEAQTATNQHQEGHLAGTWGRLLPGFHVECDGTGVYLTGESVRPDGIHLSGGSLDANGMLSGVAFSV